MTLFTRTARYAGIDRTAVYGFATLIWSMGAGLLTVLAIAIFFTSETQGYYYTFLSLAAIQTFFELGLNQVIIQFAAHEWAQLRLENGRISGNADALSRLASLGRLSGRYFTIGSILFLIGLLVVGVVTFSSHSGKVAWRGPWTVLCFALAMDLFLLPFWSLLEGCNQLRSLYFIRLARAVANSVAFWIAIVLGAGLWSIAISVWAGIAIIVVLAAARHSIFFSSLFEAPVAATLNWWRDVWPMQWRIALTWCAGYFFFALFIPVLFRYRGAIEAGQLGMTLSMAGALSSIGTILVKAKVPTFGILIADRKWQALDELAFRVGLSSVLIIVAGSAVLLSVVIIANLMHSSLATRVLPPLPFAIFLAATMAGSLTTPMSYYLRAHKQEPLVGVGVAASIIVGINTIVLGRYWGALGMGIGYAATTIVFSLPAITFLFLRCRSAWHPQA
jgi:O-antigen/teichoic acid export membrane protein